MACVVEDCNKEIFSKANRLCGMHYYRLLRNGSVETDEQPKRKAALNWHQRFWNHVNKTSDCWEWTSALDNDGYGIIQLSQPVRMNKKAHRISYELSVGPIPEGMTIDHLCRNKKCVNPEHLEVVTGSENAKRANYDSGFDAGVKWAREQIAQEIENLRVSTCRCESVLEPWCDALIQAKEIAGNADD